jgi:hypothetical protein
MSQNRVCVYFSEENTSVLKAINKLQIHWNCSRSTVLRRLITYYEYGVLDKNELEST